MKFEIDKTYVDKLASHNGDFKNLPFAVGWKVFKIIAWIKMLT